MADIMQKLRRFSRPSGKIFISFDAGVQRSQPNDRGGRCVLLYVLQGRGPHGRLLRHQAGLRLERRIERQRAMAHVFKPVPLRAWPRMGILF
jgi:hypothetical protein